MIPTQAALQMIIDAHPLDRAYARAYADVQARKHMEEVEAGCIRLIQYLLQCKAANLQCDCIILYSGEPGRSPEL